MNCGIKESTGAESARADSLHSVVQRRASNRNVDSLPVKSKLKEGQIVVEQNTCGIIFSFPAAVWPSEARKQRDWIERLTPWWDMTMPDWTPQAHRLRESCVQAINNLTRPDGPETAHRERRAESLNAKLSESARENPKP